MKMMKDFKLQNFNLKPKFYGRRKGRTIRKAKSFLLDEFLPNVLLNADEQIDVKKCFPVLKEKYCLEIGFGDGEHLAAIAKSQPQNGFIGVEVYKNGVANLLSLITGIKDGNKEELFDGVCISEDRVDNIRVFDDDIRLLFSSIPNDTFDKVFLLFPDPWPKKKHSSRRFINVDNLQELARIMKKGGILQVATDHHIYKCWTLDILSKNNDFRWTAKSSNDWRYPPSDWFETKYQRKAIREGRKPVFFEFEKI